MVIKRFLVESHADTPYDTPHDLTGGGLRIDDAPGGNRIDNACHADDPKLLVHLHFGEDRRVLLRACLVSSGNSADLSRTMRSTPPCCMASATDTAA